jgi:hypothetical protein
VRNMYSVKGKRREGRSGKRTFGQTRRARQIASSLALLQELVAHEDHETDGERY